jgi:hypothetical protein
MITKLCSVLIAIFCLAACIKYSEIEKTTSNPGEISISKQGEISISGFWMDSTVECGCCEYKEYKWKNDLNKFRWELGY